MYKLNGRIKRKPNFLETYLHIFLCIRYKISAPDFSIHLSTLLPKNIAFEIIFQLLKIGEKECQEALAR